MSVLEFKGYSVKTLSYTKNPQFNMKDGEISFSPNFSAAFRDDGDDTLVELQIALGSLTDSSVPFKVVAVVIGRFHYKADEDETNIGTEQLLHTNAVAILYPYVRTLIANITNASNEFPTFNLPTIDVTKALNAQKAHNTDDSEA